ncbi:MAG: hypothetical protein M1820_007882 [Bogoriella megaspora]|nr:MAG: hypothetical protein M1820_007882 [Bogoriella megaspora]
MAISQSYEGKIHFMFRKLARNARPGCGRSTRLREKAGDESFWTVELFIKELENLVEFFGLQHRGFNFLGQSWGGMLGGHLILADAPSSVPFLLKGENELVKKLPEDVRKAIGEGERTGDYESGQYGPSELKSTGNLKDWEGYSEAHKISVPTLLINGRYDEVQDIAVAPWFMNIPKVKWIQLEKSSHMGHYEERDRYMQFVGAFLKNKNAELDIESAIWQGKDEVGVTA